MPGGTPRATSDIVRLMLLLLLVLQTGPARDLVEKLRSDKVEERDDAARKLKAMGPAAVDELRKVEKEIDLAAHLLKVIALALEIPELTRRFPGWEERLVSMGPAGWIELLRKTTKYVEDEPLIIDTLPLKERNLLVTRALAGARDGNERTDALRTAGRYQIAETIPIIGAILAETPELEQGIAIQTLGEIGTAAAVPFLVTALRAQSPGIRVEAVGGFYRAFSREGDQALIAALRDPSSGVRHKAVEIIAWRDLRDEAIPGLVARLSDEEPAVRVGAAETLERLGAADAVEQIEPLLKDARAPVRARVAAALCGLGCRKAVEVFLQSPREDEDDAFGIQVGSTRYVWRYRPPHWNALNGVRQPEVWKRLKSLTFGRAGFKGSGREALERVAREARLGLELSKSGSDVTKEWLANPYSEGYGVAPDTHLRVLQSAHYSALRFILEPDRIRFVIPEEEEAFWKSWGEEERKK